MKLTTRLLKEMIQQELLEMEKGDKTEYYKKEGNKSTKISKEEFDELAKGRERYAGHPGPVGIETEADHIEMVEI